MDVDVGVVYAEGRRRVGGLVAGLDAEGAATTVPACPEWSVKDVVAHLTGICADVLAGNLEGVATDPWTAAQVEARRSASLGEVVAEWNELAPQVEAMAADFGPAGHQWVGDFATHEHDIRGALRQPASRDSQAVAIGVEFIAAGFLASVADRGLPVLALEAGDWRSTSGAGTPAATLVAEPFELLRAMTGRRSAEQVAALGWSTDPGPWLGCLDWGPFTVRPDPLDE
ncbi:MAG: maleylpyruvate isomerase family mycothiol-dependent enzyme [Actinomycetota bacterium]|nr:maleylpyruvate isomerase family mycothiol-dependent enzyme [Actinomycetota bacterium]